MYIVIHKNKKLKNYTSTGNYVKKQISIKTKLSKILIDFENVSVV